MQHDPIENGELKPNSAKIMPLETIDKHEQLPKDEPQQYIETSEQTEMREKLGQFEKSGKFGQLDKIEMGKAESIEIADIPITKQEKTLEQESQPPKSAKNVEKLPLESVTTNGTASANVVPEKASNEKPRSSKSKKNHYKNDHEKLTDGVNHKPDEKLKSSKSVDKLIERPLVPTSKANEHTKDSKPPRTALRSASIRPISARPSAPRRRDRNVRQILHTESFVQDSTDPSKSDKKNMMPEFDDADNIVITDTITDNVMSIDELVGNRVDDVKIDGKQGHLVQQILETQTAILKSDAKNDVAVVNLVTFLILLHIILMLTFSVDFRRKYIERSEIHNTQHGRIAENDSKAIIVHYTVGQNDGIFSRRRRCNANRTVDVAKGGRSCRS